MPEDPTTPAGRSPIPDEGVAHPHPWVPPPAAPPSKTIEGATVVELLEAARVKIGGRRIEANDARIDRDPNHLAAREFSLAITAVEDATMRYNRGRAMMLDRYHVADLDQDEA